MPSPKWGADAQNSLYGLGNICYERTNDGCRLGGIRLENNNGYYNKVKTSERSERTGKRSALARFPYGTVPIPGRG